MADLSPLNEAQQRRLLSNAQHADKLLSEIEAILNAAESRSIFPKFRLDVTPAQARLIRNHIARFREHLGRAMRALGVQYEGPSLGALHAIRVTLAFIRIAAQEMAPRYLRGYGELPEWAAPQLQGLASELEGILESLDRALAEGPRVDLRARLERLAGTTDEAARLRQLEEIISRHELAELRPRLAMLVERLESRQYEIAVFGRVNSGKSSLLNRVLGQPVLPVGVTPITAVPTRLVYGPVPRLTVAFADRRVEHHPIEALSDFVTEERNPSNTRAVARLVVELPSERLRDGLVFVDTPGLGSLAAAGAAETLAYLPQCDLGVLLVSAASPINEEDLATLQLLHEAGIPAQVLLSKADLLSAADLESALSYTWRQVRAALEIEVGVRPVSTLEDHLSLLENWFEQEIAPLYARHFELAQESLRRKTEALRRATAAALRARLWDAASGPERDHLIAAESRLRQAAGQFEEVRTFVLRAADEIRRLPSPALEAASEALARALSSGDWTGRDQLVVRAISQVAAAAGRINERMAALAADLAASLRAAARALGYDDAPDEADLFAALGQMPRFDLAELALPVKPPWVRRPRRLLLWTLRRRLTTACGLRLEEAFTAYSRVLSNWVRQSLEKLQERFDAAAEPYRAQLTVRIEQRQLGPEQRQALRADLEQLEGSAPEASTRPTAPVEPA